jgi:hypothetical protein
LSTVINERVEQIGEDYGITVRYRVHGATVEFFAAEVLYLAENRRWYERKGDFSPMHDPTKELDEAQRLVEGMIKWDGCAHYNFGDENGYLHLCGSGNADVLANTITEIHRRCGELMTEAGTNLLEGNFSQR